MTSLNFIYSPMNAGKSIELLKVAHNYLELGRKPLLMTSALDERSGKGKIKARVQGMSSDAIAITENMNVFAYVSQLDYLPNAVLVDESQFLNEKQVIELTKIVDNLNIPVMAFGLKNTFKNTLFEGSEALLAYADKITEIKTLCSFCEHKATMNLLKHDGKYINSGKDIFIGDNEYLSVCRKHYNETLMTQSKKIEKVK